MEYKIALPPDLGLNPNDFVSAWNESPECASVAVAELTSKRYRSFDPAALDALTLMVGLASGIASNVLYDLIKSILVKQRVLKETEIIEHVEPNGELLLLVRIVEK